MCTERIYTTFNSLFFHRLRLVNHILGLRESLGPEVPNLPWERNDFNCRLGQKCDIFLLASKTDRDYGTEVLVGSGESD